MSTQTTQTLSALVAAHNLHAEPADDCGGVRLFVDCVAQSEAYRDAFALSDFVVSSVNGPFLFLAPRELRHRLYHRGPDGYPSQDAVMRESYGKIPVAIGGEFQSGMGYGYERPLAVFGWGWSATFGRWSALVLFSNGWRGFTYPRLWRSTTPEELAAIEAAEAASVKAGRSGYDHGYEREGPPDKCGR